ncbi:hypothetical protein PHYBOEH_004847 [Phytophthora boehmeriae]|uniref:Uncharacterized protein n=1 Tax=Phytophthora boehmeriae TaxID=109152 RepID=A0A8T1WSD7_9STRA|nr:hypothetical protein PHYBOEH_004847 [Phytophthora boehmeriae]
MKKRSLSIEEASNSPRQTKSLKPSVELSECCYCHKSFKPRGLKLHQNRCKSKPPKKPLVYKFCILNENIFERVLSFLNNQTLTKLQAITGDHYPNCESSLSQFCCRCENDNPAIQDGLCFDCDKEGGPNYKPRVTTTEARAMYKIHDLSGVRHEVRKHYTLYNREDLQRHMLRTFRSKLAWLRMIEKKVSISKKLAQTKHQKQEEFDAFLGTLATGFGTYLKNIESNKKDQEVLKECSERFVTLSKALDDRDLKLRADSKLCKDFIMTGARDLGFVVDTMEEMKFLFAHTPYIQWCENKIESIREYDDMWYPREEYRDMMQSCRDDAKMELCVEHLSDSKGLTLPRKWEQCRARYENAVSVGADSRRYVYHIYTGKGATPKTPKTKNRRSK